MTEILESLCFTMSLIMLSVVHAAIRQGSYPHGSATVGTRSLNSCATDIRMRELLRPLILRKKYASSDSKISPCLQASDCYYEIYKTLEYKFASIRLLLRNLQDSGIQVCKHQTPEYKALESAFGQKDIRTTVMLPLTSTDKL